MSDLHALVGAYALDAVDPLERARVERHLDTCEDCRRETRSFVETAALVAGAVSAAPPAALRRRLLDEVATVRPLPPVGPHAPRHRHTPSAVRRWRPVLVAAAAALVVGVGVGVWQPWHEDPPAQAQLTTTERVLRAADAERVVVEVGEARATLVRSRAVGRAVLVTEAMPPAPAGSAYELWFQAPDGDMVPAGTMPRRTDQTVLLTGDATQATAVGITVEEGGSTPADPTSEPIVLFDLADA